MTINVSGTPPLLVSVAGCEADKSPAIVPEKLIDAGERVSVGADAPLPDNCAVCVPAPSTRVIVPVAEPVCVGAKVTVTAQSPSAAIELPHALYDITNGAVTFTLVMGIAIEPLFSDRHRQCRDVSPLPPCQSSV